jgi:hypothetical protein
MKDAIQLGTTFIWFHLLSAIISHHFFAHCLARGGLYFVRLSLFRLAISYITHFYCHTPVLFSLHKIIYTLRIFLLYIWLYFLLYFEDLIILGYYAVSTVNTYRRFKGSYCLRKIGTYLPVDTAQYPKRFAYPSAPLWGPDTAHCKYMFRDRSVIKMVGLGQHHRSSVLISGTYDVHQSSARAVVTYTFWGIHTGACISPSLDELHQTFYSQFRGCKSVHYHTFK